MIRIYLRAFRLCHKKYFPRMLGWLLVALIEVPFYILMVFCFENLSSHVEPFKNGLWVICLATICFFIHLISDLNLFQCAMVHPTRDLQVSIFKHFLRTPPRLYPEISSGELTNLLFSQITAGWFAQGIIKSIYYIVRIASLFCIIAYASITLGLAAIVPVFILVFSCRSMGKSFVNAHARTADAGSRFRNFITDTLNGVLEVKLFNTTEFHVNRTQDLAKEYHWHWLRADFLGEGVNALSVSLPQLVIPLFLVMGGHFIEQGMLSVAQLISLYIILNLLNNAISEAGILLGYALNYGGQLKVILDFFEKDQEGRDEIDFSDGEIRFENVCFSYKNGDNILKDISFHIIKDEKIAFVGASGEGKSTLLSLLRGMYFPSSGCITIDGRKLKQDNAPSLRRHIASVSQDAYLFDDDLLFNLSFGKEKSILEISEALDIVGLKDFTDQIPDGLHTHFGNNGYSVSGGEKIRICLARAILMDRKILILDEFTSNIDSVREEEIVNNIFHRMNDKTIIVISHRLSSVRDFPRIIYISNGKIHNEGSHKDLIKNEKYMKLFSGQVNRLG